MGIGTSGQLMSYCFSFQQITLQHYISRVLSVTRSAGLICLLAVVVVDVGGASGHRRLAFAALGLALLKS